MPLSEHEQRLLEQMERALYAEDPKFASSLRSSGPRPGIRRSAVTGVLAKYDEAADAGSDDSEFDCNGHGLPPSGTGVGLRPTGRWSWNRGASDCRVC